MHRPLFSSKMSTYFLFRVNRVETTKFRENSLRKSGLKIWNSLPQDVKDLTSLSKFTEFIKTWYGSECRCNICKYSGNPYHYTWTWPNNLAWICPNGNLSGVYSLTRVYFYSFFFPTFVFVSDLIRSVTVFIV